MSVSDIEAGQDADFPGGEAAGGAGDGGLPGFEGVLGGLTEVRFVDLVRARQVSRLSIPRVGVPMLPLGELDPEVLERLAAEMIKRRPNFSAHFYGRRGQKQYGLDIVERETSDFTTVYQVRRYNVLTPEKISSAVGVCRSAATEGGGPKPARRFAANKYVLLTSAEFEQDTALQDTLEELRAKYADDLIIDVWGRERVSSELRDSGALVNSVFGPDWARMFCGFAPPPPAPGDPDRLGLVEDPVQVLENLDALASDARARENGDPLESARLYGLLADTLEEANFPAHAAAQRARQGQLLHAGGDIEGAFTVLWALALAHFTNGQTTGTGPVHHALDAVRPGLDPVRTAKLDVLAAAQDWYGSGCQLAVAVPALEVVRDSSDPDTALLACVALEQALADGWFDFQPPRSLVDPGGNTPDLLDRLRRCATGLYCADVVIRARLACALADTSLAADSTAAATEAAYAQVLRAVGTGRHLHAEGLMAARAAYALAMHGDVARAIDLWRKGILLASESRLYGDVLGCRWAINAAVFEQPKPQWSDFGHTGALPNADRLLAATQSPELDALRAARAGGLPDAFGSTRRYLWESRLAGHLRDERAAMEMFGDIALAAVCGAITRPRHLIWPSMLSARVSTPAVSADGSVVRLGDAPHAKRHLQGSGDLGAAA